MSGLPSRPDDAVNGIDVREQGNALRVATNTPHLVSLGTGRLSTAVTLHPIKQGRVTVGSDPTCDIHVAGTGVCPIHCRVENSHAVVTLYPLAGSTLLDGLPVERPTRLSQGSMLTIGRSNYLRFNHPEEAKLMKSVLPGGHISMAPIQFAPNEQCAVQPPPGFASNNEMNVSEAQYYQQTDAFKQKIFKDATLNALDRELDMTLKELGKRKPPVAPRKPFKDLDQTSDSNSDRDSVNSLAAPTKSSSIMAKVSKFEYYAKQQKIGRSQFYTNENVDYSPKVFSSNMATLNTPARDVLGGKNAPTNYKIADRRIVQFNENNAIDPKSCSYANVMIKNKISRIDDMVKNFDERFDGVNLKKVNNVDSERAHNEHKNDLSYHNEQTSQYNRKALEQLFKENDPVYHTIGAQCQEQCQTQKRTEDPTYGRIGEARREAKYNQPSPSFDRNPQFPPEVTSHVERNVQAENMRLQAYHDRVEEQHQREAESARLEEILSMCAEYERQISAGTPSTPTEKRSQNKIITNGSLPRSSGPNNPNFIQTSDGYFKFDTSQNRLQNSPMSKSLPIQRNLSNYENIDMHQISPLVPSPKTPQITIRNPSSYENIGRMDEIGIPMAEELSSPVVLKKFQNQGADIPKIPNVASPLASPYENMFYAKPGVFKPKSPNTQSPRTRIKTTFAHKNISPPQYFVFPIPPPIKDDSENIIPCVKKKFDKPTEIVKASNPLQHHINAESHLNIQIEENVSGIEKQLSLDEVIPMIDDSDIANDLECRSTHFSYDTKSEKTKIESTKAMDKIETKEEVIINSKTKNLVHRDIKKFEDVKIELIADIPELEEFERDLVNNKRDKILDKLTNDVQNMICVDTNDRPQSEVFDNIEELKARYDSLRESRRKLLSEIHELKCKMTEIRTQEDDILRELEMEKALIKGEYDSEIAILNIEHKNKKELIEKANRVEEDMKAIKQKQEEKQKELKERVVAAAKEVERLETNLPEEASTSEDLQNARDVLDNETKLFEDLEFQHLEAESEMLAYREDLQNEIIALTKKIESQKSRILTLKSEANNNLTSALEETRVLQADYVQLLNKVEELTTTVQSYEKELKEISPKLNMERAQSPFSSYSAEIVSEQRTLDHSLSSSDSDDVTFEVHQKNLNDKFNSIDQMSQSMIVDLGEKRQINDLIDPVTVTNEVPENLNASTFDEKEQSSPKEKKGFWERNFDSLSRLKSKKKSPPKVDIMSHSLNENMFFNNENIESDYSDRERFGSLKHTKKKQKQQQCLNNVQTPVKSSSSSKIPTFSSFGKIIRKESIGRKNKEVATNKENLNDKTRSYKTSKYSKSQTPDIEESLNESGMETENERSSYADSLEGTIEDLPEQSKAIEVKKPLNEHNRTLLRKSCGDEPGILSIANNFTTALSESGKAPSQDDIDRISKVRINTPLVLSEADKNSLGRKTLDSLMEIERNRLAMLEEQGCQVIEHEREKMSELKRRVQSETKKRWESERETKSACGETERDGAVTESANDGSFADSAQKGEPSVKNDRLTERTDRDVTHSTEHSFNDTFDAFNSNAFADNESSGIASSSIEELQSRSSSIVKRRDGGRPLSGTSDASNDTRPSLRVAPYFARTDLQRPLTRYLPIDGDDLDLKRHIESAGHQVQLCPHVSLDSTSCRGYLHKLGAKFHTWSKRWFVFDRDSKTFIYYSDKSERKPRGGAYFQVIEEVYLDHGNTSRSPSPQTTFVVKTRQRRYYLMSPSGEAARIWIDVIFTGAQGYTEYLQ